MLYLNNKQIAQLLLPLITLGLLFFFQDEILSFMHEELPTNKNKITSSKFKNKMQVYLHIDRDKKAYDEIQGKEEQRNLFNSWITKNLLYKERNKQKEKQNKMYSTTIDWNLQAVFPKHKMAIINSKFVKEGALLQNAKIIKIEFDSVLLKTKKGLQWVHLFH